MTQHTPEPWKINHDDSTEEWSIVTNQHGSIVANVNEETGPELAGSIPVMRKMPGMENARRIVACVNACEGLDLDMLERFGLGTALGHEIYRITEQRDELLAALEDFIKYADDCSDDSPELFRARAAIKKTTGETK